MNEKNYIMWWILIPIIIILIWIMVGNSMNAPATYSDTPMLDTNPGGLY